MNNVYDLNLARAANTAMDAVFGALERPRTAAERDYEALRESRKDYHEKALQLTRMAQEASEAAQECHETVARIDEQLNVAWLRTLGKLL